MLLVKLYEYTVSAIVINVSVLAGAFLCNYWSLSMPRVSYDYTGFRSKSHSLWMYFSTILPGSKPGLWQVVITILFVPSSPSSPRRNFIAAVHYPPFSSSSHSSHDNLPIASLLGGGMVHFSYHCIFDMFFPRRRCGSILGILTVSLLFGSSKRLVRSRNHRWSWSICCFGSVFGTAFSVPPV